MRRDSKAQARGDVPSHCLGFNPGSAQSDMTIGAQEVKRGARDPCPRELPVVGGIAGNHAGVEQVA
jgi:hypothetical protein